MTPPVPPEEPRAVNTHIISAICTPLDADESLHVEGLEAHLEDQWTNGINSLLVGGTMGLMQLLSDETYLDLVRHAARFSAGRGELLVGVGDTSFRRTRDRILRVADFPIDGVVVLTPYLIRFGEAELVHYFQSLADVSPKPVFLYYLPVLTGVQMTTQTVATISKHPNIRGVKCSTDFAWTRELMPRVDETFRIIVAQPTLTDLLMRAGVREFLDGIYSVVPDWTMNIVRAGEAGQWDVAARHQAQLSALLQMLRANYPLFPAITAILNARGIPGNLAPAPMPPLTEEQRERLLQEPLVNPLLAGSVSAPGKPCR